MSLCYEVTHSSAKDVFVGDSIIFIVAQGQIMRALGKDGSHRLHLERLLKKPVRFIAFHEDPVKFIKNVLYPLTVDDITLTDDTILVITATDARVKGKVFGREKSNLAFLKDLVQRYFGIRDVQVV